MADKLPALTLLIPTYNESAIIETALREIANTLHHDFCAKIQLIIVDDGSDDLPQKVKNLDPPLPFFSLEVLRNHPPLGKGKSLTHGFRVAQASIVGFLDVDLSTPPQYINQAFAEIASNQTDIFIASRWVEGAKVTRVQFFLKDILGNLLGVLARAIIFAGMRNYKDTQCGFKFYKSKFTSVLYEELHAPDGLNDLEVLLRANMLGLRVREQGVVWTDIRESKRSLRRILWGEIKAFLKILYFYKLRARSMKKFLRKKLESIK